MESNLHSSFKSFAAGETACLSSCFGRFRGWLLNAAAVQQRLYKTFCRHDIQPNALRGGQAGNAFLRS